MAVNDNLNTQRPASGGRRAASGSTGAPTGPTAPATRAPARAPQAPSPAPEGTPHRVAPRPDEALLAIRPSTEAERHQDVLARVRAAQGQPLEAQNAEAPAAQEDETPTAKKIADGIGLVDGVREGARIATNADELAQLPGVGRTVQGGSRLGRFFSRIADSRAGQAVSLALKEHRVIAPTARFLGRIAPFAGLAVAGYDLYDADKTNRDPKASTTERALSTTKAVLSSIAGVAGVATLALAPTGVGAAIAGGVAIGAGLLTLGLDLWLGRVRKDK